jgi:hypothetical protein
VTKQSFLRSGSCILLAFAAVFVLFINGASAQTETADGTPVPAERTSYAFQFYPTNTGWGSYFDPTIEAGESATLKVTLANAGEVTQDLRMYAIDAHTDNGGGFAAAEYGTPPNDVTQWVELEDTVYTLEPGKGVETTFVVTVPEGTPPGQYITAVVGAQAQPLEVEGSEGFSQVLRYPVPVFITVPGETTAGFETGAITLTAQPDALVASVELINTGDVRVRPEGSIDLLDPDGNLLASYPVEMQSIYAHDQTTLGIGFTGIAAYDSYQVRVNLTDDETGTSVDTIQSDLVASADATPVPAQFTIGDPRATPGPSADEVQFATIEATITNGGEAVSNAQLSLIASVDGEEVERFPISQSLALPNGDTPISTRYIPATGFTSGTWTFELVLESVDASGVAVVVARAPVEGSISIS